MSICYDDNLLQYKFSYFLVFSCIINIIIEKEGKDVRRKVALITGGATGIGNRTAKELAKRNYDIVITYVHSENAAKELVHQLQEDYQIKAKCYYSDVSVENDCKQLINIVNNDFDGVDVFVHNAGPYIHERKRMSEYSIDEWQYVMNGNLNSFFYLAKLVLPYMREQKWGRIITFGFDRSDSSPGWIYRSAFSAAKSGLTSLTKTLALEEAANGITVNMICPGDIIPDWKEKAITDAIEVEDASVPVGRPGTGEDIARVVYFLTKEQSSFITGAIIPVTGGKDVLGKIFK